MPTVPHAALARLVADVLEAAGAAPAVAASVAGHLVENDLKGVDSHGIVRVPSYLGLIARGEIDARAEPAVGREGPASAVVDGGGGFGMVAMETALSVLSAKVRETGVAAAGVVNCGHTGRIGSYAERAAEDGLFALILGGGGGRDWGRVVPHGGAEPRLGTNPYAFALPAGEEGPVVVDFATSVAAQGKLAVARATGAAVPAGWIVDSAGRPTTDAEDFYAGGALLPAAGHKGYGLALIAEMVGGALLAPLHELNWLFTVIDVARFRPLAEYRDAAEAVIAHVVSSAPAPGSPGVRVPGRIEAGTAAERRAAGIPVANAVWRELAAAADKLGIDADAAVAADG